MKYSFLAPVALALCIGFCGAAQAVNVDVNIGVPGVVVVPAAPVYVAPRPVYAAPPVVVIRPGWYGDRYYDGRRYWARREWEERHHGEWERDRHEHQERYHCPPGHAKKGEC